MAEKIRRKRSWFRTLLRWGLRLTGVLVVLLVAAFGCFFRTQLYHGFYFFPKQAAVLRELATARQPVALQTGWHEYRGVMHSHSHISHDSEVPFPEIVEALKKAQCQFICMSDHPVEGKADYSWGWKGVHDGILFIRGFEMQEGFMPWGLPDGTVFDKQDEPVALAKRIRELGGILCIAHCEEPRPWEIAEIDGMEIYNIHTDMKADLGSAERRTNMIKEILINQWKYGDQVFVSLFDRPVMDDLLALWDKQNHDRKMTGIAGNDCHQNTGFRGVYTAQDSLLILDTGHNDPKDKAAEYRLNRLTRLLLRLCFGRMEAEQQLFRIDLDPYDRMARFVNTHVLATDLTEPAILDAVRAGRAFVAFNMIADAAGFAYIAEGGGQRVTMGERITLTPGLKLRAEAPLPCRFTLVRNGKQVTVREAKTFDFEVQEPGKYRIQAELAILGTWTPWILGNPIEVAASAPS